MRWICQRAEWRHSIAWLPERLSSQSYMHLENKRTPRTTSDSDFYWFRVGTAEETIGQRPTWMPRLCLRIRSHILFDGLGFYLIDRIRLGLIDCQRPGFTKSFALPEFFLSVRIDPARSGQFIGQQYDFDFPHGWLRHSSWILGPLRYGPAIRVRRWTERRSRHFWLFHLTRIDIVHIWQL